MNTECRKILEDILTIGADEYEEIAWPMVEAYVRNLLTGNPNDPRLAQYDVDASGDLKDALKKLQGAAR